MNGNEYSYRSEQKNRGRSAARHYILGNPVPEEYSERHEKGTDGMTVEQKMTAVVLDLKKIYPLLFAAVTVIPRVESIEIPQIAVSPDTLYYNSTFVMETPREELLFYLVHSIYHILMQHHNRGFGKDPLKWNAACDLYINKCIHEAFGLLPDGEARMLISEDGQKVFMAMPETEGFDEKIDLSHETPESIYYRRNPEEDKEMSGKSGSFGDSGRNGQGDKQGNEGESTSQKGLDGSGEQANDKGDSSDKSETGENENDSELESSKEGESKGDSKQQSNETGPSDTASEQSEKAPEGDGSGESETGKNPETESFENQKPSEDTLPEEQSRSGEDPAETRQESEIRVDLIDDAKSRMDSIDAKMQRTQRLLSKIETIHRQINDLKYGRGVTDDPVLLAEIHKNMDRVNWRTILMTHLVRIVTDEKSLSTPDRRFVHTGLYLEGPVREENEVRDIKICIDTSASMNERDIADALFQIECLLRQFKIRAELVFWDEEIDARVDFSDRHEFKLAERAAKGRGGTNPDCLFEAFAQTNKKGHTDPIPELVLIFTDGYFELPKREYHRPFRDRTIWILCSEDSEEMERFSPGFGKVIDLNVHV